MVWTLSRRELADDVLGTSASARLTSFPLPGPDARIRQAQQDLVVTEPVDGRSPDHVADTSTRPFDPAFVGTVRSLQPGISHQRAKQGKEWRQD
jgi:hypothetical protein